MVPYRHTTHPRARSIKIKVEPNGEVVVVTPPRFSERAVEEFVRQNQAWIVKTLAKMEQRKQYGDTATQVYVFGKPYSKKLVSRSDINRGVAISGSEIIINLPDVDLHLAATEDKKQKYIERFLKNTAEQYIVPRTHQLAKIMGISFGQISLKQQKTRWGSCSSDGNLNFNWRLVHSPPAVIDYVIIHELSHRRHMNHSTAFWNLVAQYDPAHQQHRGWLKRHGMAVG